MMRGATLGLLALVGAFGCGQEFVLGTPAGAGGATSNSVASVGGGGPGGGNATTTSATGGGGGGAGEPAALSDDGLVVRYFIDEALDGKEPADLIDSAPDPLNLPFLFEGSMRYEGPEDEIGLVWDAAGENGRASAPIDGTKMVTRLEGSQTFTVELVTEVAAAVGQNSRLFLVNVNTNNGKMGIAARDTNSARLAFNDNFFDFQCDWLARDRTVVHAVVDTTLNDGRVKMYLDGEALTLVGNQPPINVVLSLGTGHSLTVGNRAIGARSIEGKTSYAAIYDEAFDEERIIEHVERLEANDDGP